MRSKRGWNSFLWLACISKLLVANVIAREENGQCANNPSGRKAKYWLANVRVRARSFVNSIYHAELILGLLLASLRTGKFAMQHEHLEHVKDAFSRLGYELADSAEDDWSLLWAFHSPFHQRRGEPNVPALVEGLKSHQQVNQLPGAAAFASKVQLVTASHELPFLPQSFRFPDHLEKFRNASSENPEMEWLVKGSMHRGVQFVSSVDEAQEVIGEGSDAFVQQLVRPYLIDGKLWDVGIYVAVTSVDPLRVYVYDNLLMRHCSGNYSTDLATADRDSYVVAEGYQPPWAIPSLRPYYTRGMSTANVLRAYLSDQGVDFDPVLLQMKEYIIRLLRHFQPHLVSSARSYDVGAPGFFSMFRFDFMLDPNMQPWLIEINQSPNLASDANPDLKNMFQRIAYSLLNLNGYGYGQLRHPKNAPDQVEVIAHHNDIDIGWRLCSKCSDTCDGACLICRHCRTSEQSRMLQELLLEHRNGQGFKRLYPPSAAMSIRPDVKKLRPYTENDELTSLWIDEQCLSDHSWC